MKIHKLPICIAKGHDLQENICNTICSNNWLRKCRRCGLYVMHGESGSVMISEKEATRIKENFEKEFPYTKK